MPQCGNRTTVFVAIARWPPSPAWHRRERGKRQAARNLIRRIQIRGLVDRQAARAGKALWLLEQHHSKPKYKLDFQLRERLESSSSMPWKKQYESWQEPTYPAQYWGSWQKSPKPQRAKKEKEDRSKPFLYGHDGKRVEIQDGSFSKSFSSSSHTGPPEDAAKEENKLLKDTIRKLLDQKGPTPEDLLDLEKILAKDPREELRERQRHLNQDRRALNKSSRVKVTMDESEKSFNSWKHVIEAGLVQEERRHLAEMAELRMELKVAEKGENAMDDAWRVETTLRVRLSSSRNYKL